MQAESALLEDHHHRGRHQRQDLLRRHQRLVLLVEELDAAVLNRFVVDENLIVARLRARVAEALREAQQTIGKFVKRYEERR